MAFDVGTRPETPQIDWELEFRYINNFFKIERRKAFDVGTRSQIFDLRRKFLTKGFQGARVGWPEPGGAPLHFKPKSEKMAIIR